MCETSKPNSLKSSLLCFSLSLFISAQCKIDACNSEALVNLKFHYYADSTVILFDPFKDATIPNYDQWLTVNTSRLYYSCVNHDHCDFQVASSYNHLEKYWLSNGKRLDDVIWRSYAYPDLKDILTICGFIDYT